MNGPLKSQGLNEFVQVLYRELFTDLQRRYPKHRKSLRLDCDSLCERIRKEGLSFATKKLPRLGKLLDSALDKGTLEASPDFSKVKGSRTIPVFLQGLFSELFSVDGSLVVGANAHVVRDIRQILYLVYKMELPYSPEEERRVIDAFLKNEEEILSLDLGDSPFLNGASSLCHEILQGFDPVDILPRHGPGSVATGEKLDEKWEFSRLYSEIHRMYPYYDYFMVGGSAELLDRIKWYRGLSRESVGVAKVVLVPKDSRGPRLISCEPLEYQWIQQGLNSALVRHLERQRLTRGQINFQDQSVNQQLARESSLHHAYSTIDLKDASDRVSLQLVERLFPKDLMEYFRAVRSHATRLPDGRIVPLTKYAPMGSAVCFSVEALVFWCICVDAVRITGLSLREAAQSVYVYGDDIIVPTMAYQAVLDALHRAGLVVNEAKCCSHGDFRESCGVDAFKGIDVTPTRISTVWSREPSSGECLFSYAAYANAYWQKGYTELATTIRAELAGVHGNLPCATARAGFPAVLVETDGEAHTRNAEAQIPSRLNSQLQRVEYRVKVADAKRIPTTLDGWPRLLRAQVRMSGEVPDEVVIPRSTKIRRRWRTV